jgi:[acyl-carrier-protein] S-malonyltransferase
LGFLRPLVAVKKSTGDKLVKELAKNIANTALSFRGYNVTNLGRTAELLAQQAYRPLIVTELERFGALCSEVVKKPVDLVQRVEQGVEPALEDYAEALSLVVAIEVAQMRLLHELHHVDTSRAKMAFGYSLGELVAVSFGGMFALDDMMRVPLAMAEDCVALAANATMGVLFSRGPTIDENQVSRLCQQITGEGRGTIGISAILSPNTFLLMGQDNTVVRFGEIMHDLLPQRAHLRLNSHRWPPMHTPIVRQKHIPDRSSVMMESLPGGLTPACPPVFSLVTGKMSYNDHSARDVLRQWVDHPQRLWSAVDKTLSIGVETVIHVGPDPNVIPATFRRLCENVLEQTAGNSISSLSMRAVSGLARRPWLAAMLPSNAALLRAPYVKHVNLEDWLLENPPQ